MGRRPLDRQSRYRLGAVAAAAVVVVAPAPAAAAPPPAGAGVPARAAAAPSDRCGGQCGDILPPGENGNATLVDILGNRVLGTTPPHARDQLDRYAALAPGYQGLTDAQLGRYFDDASFGVPADQVERTERPRADVTVVRDRATGVPHVTGTSRAGTMFGAGYAGAEDRLFLMDLLRHVGRGQLTSFAGGAPGNRALEQSVWRVAPYTDADLQAQIDALRADGDRGARLYDDVQNYLAGVNAYIAACLAARDCPGEYVLTGHLDAITNAGGPQPFQATDIVAIAGVIGGLFGGGGGAEMTSALVRIAARARYGTDLGDRVWRGLREQNDPETVLTLHDGQRFPYGQAPADAPSVVLPDPGTAAPVPVVFDPSGSAATGSGGAATGTGPAARGVLPGLAADLAAGAHGGMSNAVVI